MDGGHLLKGLYVPDSCHRPYTSSKRLACRKLEVSDYVDAQNSFGAKMRTYYHVFLLFHGHKTWKLAAISFGIRHDDDVAFETERGYRTHSMRLT